MKTSYDLSFLTSPRDPRHDNWIGQPFVLSYLNSEPGANFVFDYKPFGIVHSRINKESAWAERAIERTSTEVDLLLVDRSSQKGNNYEYRDTVWGWRPSLEMIVSRGFTTQLQHATAIVDVLRHFDLIREEARLLPDQTLVTRYIEEKYINPVISRLQFAAPAQIIVDTVLYLYRLYDHALNHKREIHILEWLNAVELDREAVGLVRLLLSRMKETPKGIMYRFLASNREKDKVSTFYEHSLLTNLVAMDSSVQTFTKAERQDTHQAIQVDGELGWHNKISPTIVIDYLNAHRKEEQAPSIRSTHKNASSIDRIGIVESGYLNGDTDINIGTMYLNSILVAKDTSNEATLTDYSLSEKLIYHQGHMSVEIRAEAFNSKYARILNSISYFNVPMKESVIQQMQMSASHHGNKKVFLIPYIFVDRFIKSKEIYNMEYSLIDSTSGNEALLFHNLMITDSLSTDSLVSGISSLVDSVQVESINTDRVIHGIFFNKEAKLSADYVQPLFVERISYRAMTIFNDIRIDQKNDYGSMISIEQILTEKINRDTRFVKDGILSTLISLDAFMWNDQMAQKISLVSNDAYIVDSLQQELVDRSGYDARINVIDKRLSSLPIDGFNYRQLETRVKKIEQSAWIQYVLKILTPKDKAAILSNNLPLFEKVSIEGYDVVNKIRTEMSDLMEKEAKSGLLLSDVDKFTKEYHPVLLLKLLNGETQKLDGFLQEMLNFGSREDAFETILQKLIHSSGPDRDGKILEVDLSSKETNIGIIQEMINACDIEQNSREGYIPKNQWVLSRDGSDWDDIWGQYSPGVDILDPPDSDYDYTQLANKVYHLDTGVPYAPLSSTNVADVKVKTPLHHPLPEHFDLGVDDTKEIVVDNYFFMDVVLAIESLKARNKLRYAGMPAEKTMRELFSKLFTWIQQAAPGSPEYERMFRFARWYAEAATLQNSEHILHRMYNAWRSSLYTGGDLGTPYTQSGWIYFPTAFVLQTNSTYSQLTFEKENYIDGELIIRGYFDNPSSQGTMEVKIDGSLVDTIRVNGAFTSTISVPQGTHTYECIFYGDAGRVSLSNIEIGGCEFVSAYTTSDDSNVNGLKAVGTLINMLLTYFDKHHGSGKLKGTMAIKQRKVWNVQT